MHSDVGFKDACDTVRMYVLGQSIECALLKVVRSILTVVTM